VFEYFLQTYFPNNSITFSYFTIDS